MSLIAYQSAFGKTTLHSMSQLKKRIQSFAHAFKGITHSLQTEVHMKLHFLAAVVVICAGFYFEVTTTEWALLIMCIVSVIGMELLNSSVEKLCDHLHPDRHETIGKVKDMAAGAVLVVSIGAAVVGGLIFWDYLMS
jgi:diacylglycerol kinase (ATP)